MPAPLLAAGVMAAGQLGNSILSSIQSRNNIRRTNNANMRLAEYQYSKDLEMWNRQNMYNRPEAQMQRLKDAGLNPNLVYGSGSVSGNTSSQLPKYNAPTLDYNQRLPVQVPNAIGQYMDLRIQQAAIDKASEQVGILESTKALKYNEWLDMQAVKYGNQGSHLQKADEPLRHHQYYEELRKRFAAETANKDEQVRRIQLQNTMQEIVNANKRAGVDSAQDPQIKALVQLMYTEGMNIQQIRSAVIGMGISHELADKILRRVNISTLKQFKK